jgi:hypothetical protein
MPTRDRHPRRGLGHEQPGAVDYPFDADPQADAEGLVSDAACTVPWRADGFEAIQVFVDPALRDQADDLCETVTAWAGAENDIDGLNDVVMKYGEQEDLSVSVFENPRDDLSKGVVAIAFTVG